MSVRRLVVAAAVLLGVTYLKCLIPSFSQEVVPAMHHVLEENQLEVLVPEPWLSWLVWN
jgi:hypothetical protein